MSSAEQRQESYLLSQDRKIHSAAVQHAQKDVDFRTQLLNTTTDWRHEDVWDPDMVREVFPNCNMAYAIANVLEFQIDAGEVINAYGKTLQANRGSAEMFDTSAVKEMMTRRYGGKYISIRYNGKTNRWESPYEEVTRFMEVIDAFAREKFNIGNESEHANPQATENRPHPHARFVWNR